jgi:hypothetical protein
MANRFSRSRWVTVFLTWAVLCGMGRAQDQSAFAGMDADASASNPYLWVSAEYLLFWVKGAPVPPLVTTGPLGVGPEGHFGVLGAPDTHVLLGDKAQDFGPLSGARINFGGWFDPEQTIGIEHVILFLTQRLAREQVSQPGTPGTPPLALPFYNVNLGAQDSTAIAFPNGHPSFSGVAVLDSQVRLHTGEINAIANVRREAGWRVDFLGGVRYLSLDERLHFSTESTNVPPFPRDVFSTFDQFQTENHFFGAQVGLKGEWIQDIFFIQGVAKVALGDMHQTTKINGELTTNDFQGFTGPPDTFLGGYLAQRTNIGKHHRDHFAVVPEIDLNVGLQLTPRLRVFTGYTFLYTSNVARPGDQIDQGINPSQGPGFTGDPASKLAGSLRPAFTGKTTDFWTQGLSLGLELQF